MNSFFISQNQSMAFLEITPSLSFIAQGESKVLSINCKRFQHWTLSGLPSGWTASNITGKGPSDITIIAPNNTNLSLINEQITITSGAKVRTCTLTQAAGYYTYATPVITITYSDIPASGGTVIPTYSFTQTYGWNGVSSGAGTIVDGGSWIFTNATNTSTGAVTASSLGTTEKARSKITTVSAQVTSHEVSAVKSVDVFQQLNQIEDSNFNPHITTWGTPTISIGSGLTAAGGSTTVSHSVTNIETYYYQYTSTDIDSGHTRSVPGSTTIAITSNGNNRFSLSGNVLNHSNMTTNLVTDTVTVTATNMGNSSKTSSASKSITNDRTTISTSGGVTTWEVVNIGSWSNKTIPASGGSATITPGNGSQTWNKSATVTTYRYDSGSEASETTSLASSGTVSISPNPTSVSATAGSKGMQASGVTTVKSEYITWAGNGTGTTSTQLVTIYQAKNDYLDVTDAVLGTIAYSDISATGGTSSPTVDIIYTAVYDSGSYSNQHGLPTISNFALHYNLSSSIFTIDPTSGVISVGENTSSSERSVEVDITLTRTYNGVANYPVTSGSTTVKQYAYSSACGTCYLTLVSSDATTETWRLDGDCCSAIVDGCGYAGTEITPGTVIVVQNNCGCSGNCAGITQQNPNQ